MAKRTVKTKKNLEEAFAGESQANRRYLAYAKRAGDEGYPEIARLFKAIAEAETVHAMNHLRVMGMVDSTKSNIAKAICGEKDEIDKMYPEYIKEAKKEDNNRAKESFSYALAVERIHHRLLKEAGEKAKQGKDLEKKELVVCPVCGNTIWDKIPDICPICQTAKEKFEKVG
jgi:rubrerythrin